MHDALAGATNAVPRGQFLAGTDHWTVQPEFLAFASRSPLPGIVARLLGSERVWLYEDSVLVKEPGTVERTVFHQDLAYFHLEGEQVCTTWVPLDPVDAGHGRRAVRARLAPRSDPAPAQPVRHQHPDPRNRR